MSSLLNLTDIYSDSPNLGDNLALTPILLSRPCRLHLYNEAWVRGIAPIFDGLAAETVWFDDGKKVRQTDSLFLARPWTKRILGYYGLWNVPAIPQIKLTETEIKEGQRIAKIYQNPCIIKGSPQKTGERTVPDHILRNIVARNPDVTFIQFGFSQSHLKGEVAYSKIPGVVEFFDTPVRDMAAIYAGVGRYVGCDTGDYHLMLAVGGNADVICPPNSPTYNYDYVHYGSDCWLNLPPRVAYHCWENHSKKSISGINLYD